MFRYEGRKRGKNHLAENLCFSDNRFYPVLYELVDTRPAIAHSSDNGFLYSHNGNRLSISFGGRIMDEPFAEEQSYGRRFQYGKRIVYAGNTTIAERVFRESTYKILV